jgi:hypothetical protein
MTFMNDYHVFKHAREVHVEEWQSCWSSNYASIIEIFVISTFVFTLGVIGMTFRIDSIGGGGSVGANGTTRNHGTTRSGGISPPISRHSIQLHAILPKVTRGFKLRNYKICKSSNISPMKAYERHMHRCVG